LDGGSVRRKASTYTGQHKTEERDSKPRSQCSSDRKLYTATETGCNDQVIFQNILGISRPVRLFGTLPYAFILQFFIWFSYYKRHKWQNI